MALKKLCSYSACRELVDYGISYCDKHKAMAEQEQKQRYKYYKASRTDKKEQAFYNSKEWLGLRQQVLNHYVDMDLYEYYVNGKIECANLVHHIIEIKDTGGWDRRLMFVNLFPCSKGTHNIIHAAYDKSDKDKVVMQRLLIDLLNKYEKEFY